MDSRGTARKIKFCQFDFNYGESATIRMFKGNGFVRFKFLKKIKKGTGRFSSQSLWFICDLFELGTYSNSKSYVERVSQRTSIFGYFLGNERKWQTSAAGIAWARKRRRHLRFSVKSNNWNHEIFLYPGNRRGKV